MEILIVLVAMAVVGLIIGALAGPIWKDNRPYGVSGDYIAAVITTIVVGLMDYYVIPAMGFSPSLKWLGVALEPALGALVVLWVLRKIKK
ncbi:MAG: hypothetical protein H6636_03815 [Anaerolineales bacterium]|nr:hypothetical protein [Anaerolineales bacterium]